MAHSNIRALLLCLFLTVRGFSQTYQSGGIVLSVDAPHKSITISGDNIPGFMDAMVMSYQVRDVKTLDNIQPGASVAFALVVDKDVSFVRDVRPRKFDSAARDPVQVSTLKLLESAVDSRPGAAKPLEIGQGVPNFSLIDQVNHPIALADLKGKLVAISFIYTRCPLPDYCFRLSNNFGQLQKRFKGRLGADLVLLSITFDPVHDPPDVLRKYASIWSADAAHWHFLTGPLAQIKEVCALFGMNFWPDEGLLTHSLHTVLIDRDGKLAANLEGNQFSAAQLGDLTESLLASKR